MIEQDRIDILVDLAGHTAGNRLLVMACKPAPVQVTYLGYPDTTGMEAIDYRLTDALAEGPLAQRFYTEELVYLPNGFLCYKPADFAPPVSPPPVQRKGHITFGSFNNNCKIHPFIMELWSRILRANDDFRLLLKFHAGTDQAVRGHYLRQFERLGVAQDRIEIAGWKHPVDHLRLYKEVDIALDTYPYNGTTTTCEALWMGVPTLSLVGEHHASRVGLTILSRVGLEVFAASTPEEYVGKAIAFAGEPENLSKIRAAMRSMVTTSALCDAKGFAHSLETAYRTMWHQWCRLQSADDRCEKFEPDIAGSNADPAVCTSKSTEAAVDLLEEV
jgi:predicted O-linked N-acetylglucosamine transferase (SPINDLY family)